MKHIPLCCLPPVCLMLLTGCLASSMVGMSPTSPSPGAAAGAIAIDTVTMPLQAPFFVLVAVEKATFRAKSTKQEKSPDNVEFIRRNPELIFARRNDFRGETVLAAIVDPNVPFTEAQFRRLAAKGEWTRMFVAGNPNCPREILDEIWQGIAQVPSADRPHYGYSLTRNPKVPSAWLEVIAEDAKTYQESSKYAREALVQRTPKETPE